MKYPIKKYIKKCVGNPFLWELYNINGGRWLPCVKCNKAVKLQKSNRGIITMMLCDNNGEKTMMRFFDEHIPDKKIIKHLIDDVDKVWQ